MADLRASLIGETVLGSVVGGHRSGTMPLVGHQTGMTSHSVARMSDWQELSQHWNQTWHVPRSSCESESPRDMTANISDLGSCKKSWQ